MRAVYGVFFLVLFCSCEKVISVKLDDAEKKYVIEGNLTNVNGESSVHITQTKSFSTNNDFPGISGAVVTMSDNGGTPVTLAETTDGNYTSNAINGTPGHVYALVVTVDGQVFTATSTMPAPVTLDSVYIEDEIIFGDSTLTVNARYQDPVGSGNAYHFIQYKNGKQEKQVFVSNDDYTNGNTVSARLMTYDNSADDDKLLPGDSVTVTMESIDQPVYKYWYSINSATGQSDNATPANPVSNISGGALGYFSAHTTGSMTIVAP